MSYEEGFTTNTFIFLLSLFLEKRNAYKHIFKKATTLDIFHFCFPPMRTQYCKGYRNREHESEIWLFADQFPAAEISVISDMLV